jgi:copper transport protein
MLLLRLGLLAVLLLVAPTVARWMRRLPTALRVAATLLAALALAGTWSAVSHSAVRSGPRAYELLDAIHLVATASWLGGLLALALVVLRPGRAEECEPLTRHFSTTAAVAVVVMVTTGVLAAVRQVGSLAALSDNTYGRLLVVKAVLVVGILLLAGVARYLLLSRGVRRWSALRTVVTVEAALGSVVLVVTAALVTTEPAQAAHAQLLASRSTPVTARASVSSRSIATVALSGSVPFDSGTGPAGRGVVQVDVVSTRPGPTEIHLTVLSTAGRALPLLRVAAALRRQDGSRTSSPVVLELLATGHYVSRGARLGTAGQWQLGIALQLPSGATAVAVAGIPVR